MTTPGTSPAMLDVGEVVDNSPIKPLHVGIFTLCALCMIMDGFDVQALGYVAPAIIQEWKISPALLGSVFGAGNFGVLIGQLSFTVLADRIGRRPVLIGGALFFAAMTLLTARATTVTELLIIRAIAGMGLGSIIPNATALVGEFSPKRVRIKWMTYVNVGFTAGAALGGFIAAAMIPRFGWRSVFYFGGAIPIVLAVLMAVWLPESLQLLVVRGRRLDYVRKWLKRLDPAAPITAQTRLVVKEKSRKGVPIAHLFQEGRALGTLLIWLISFMNLFNLYSLSNWLPTVVRGAGYSTSTAVLVGTVLQVGGTIAPFVLASLVVRRGFIPVLTVTYIIACASIIMVGQPSLTLTMLVIAVFVAGACVVGSQPSLNALSATFYPTYLRATGLGWGLGIGRAGAIVGPVMAGAFMSLKWSTRDIFLALAVPAAVSAMAVFALRWTKVSEGAPTAVNDVETVAAH
jgi:AAHS family 4-hydroxybenzoate transporter-like MFS transporter